MTSVLATRGAPVHGFDQRVVGGGSMLTEKARKSQRADGVGRRRATRMQSKKQTNARPEERRKRFRFFRSRPSAIARIDRRLSPSMVMAATTLSGFRHSSIVSAATHEGAFPPSKKRT
jgi:hypothetical protein